jgi:putative SbcD/Mre11-related phosphoesterase
MLKLLLNHPAVLIKTTEKTSIVIADPHLSWEGSLCEKGIYVPSQTQKTQKKLVTLLSKYKPNNLIILGDIKSTILTFQPGEWRDINDFFSEIKKHVNHISIVKGNHDANLEHILPEDITIHPATGLVEGDVGFFHGHKWPSPALLSCKTLIMGHVHPIVSFRDPAGFRLTRKVWIRAQIDTNALTRILLQKNGQKIEDTTQNTLQRHFCIAPKTKQLYIMPSFNDFLGGRPVNEPSSRKNRDPEELIGPILRSEAVDLENAEINLLDGTCLGTLSQIKRL